MSTPKNTNYDGYNNINTPIQHTHHNTNIHISNNPIYSHATHYYTLHSYCDDLDLLSHNYDHMSIGPDYDSYDDDGIDDGDILKMELSVKNRTLKFYVNEKNTTLGFKNMDFDENQEYIMGVSLDDKTSIQLLGFEAPVI